MPESSLLSPVKKKIRETSSPARPSKPAAPQTPASVITISSDSEDEHDVASSGIGQKERKSEVPARSASRGDYGSYSSCKSHYILFSLH